MQPDSPFLAGLIPQLPVLIVMLAGIVTGLVRWRKHPAVSLLAVVGLALLVLVLLGNFLSSDRFALLLHTRLGWNFTRIGLVQTVAGLALTLLRTLAWVLLVAAIFARRAERV